MATSAQTWESPRHVFGAYADRTGRTRRHEPNFWLSLATAPKGWRLSLERSVQLFISYSHDSAQHAQRVLGLAQQLRRDGLDCQIDQFLTGGPREGWSRWMQKKIEDSDFTLIVCSKTYKRRFEGRELPDAGRGVDWEGILVMQQLYDARSQNEKFIPVLFEGAGEGDVPLVLKGFARYLLPGDYDGLYRQLTCQPLVVPASLGCKRVMPQVGVHEASTSLSSLPEHASAPCSKVAVLMPAQLATFLAVDVERMTIVLCWNPAVGASRRMLTVMDELAADGTTDFRLASLVVSDSDARMPELRVTCYPTTLFYRHGELHCRVVGTMSRDHLLKTLASLASKKT